MFSRIRYAVKRDDATPDERQALLSARRECLHHGTAMVNGGEPLDVSKRWGWRAHVKTLGRDQDGSLLASITVTGPDGVLRVLRNVRLVAEKGLKL